MRSLIPFSWSTLDMRGKKGEEGGGLKFRANQPKILQGWRGKASFLVVISFEIYLPSLSDKAESCRCVRGVMDN